MQPSFPSFAKVAIKPSVAITAALLLGCGDPPPTTPAAVNVRQRMERYQQALTNDAGSTQDRLTDCLSMADPDLAGDCALVVVNRAVRGAAGDPLMLCPQLPEGLWRDECWFEMAEISKRKDRAQAVALCDRATLFRDDCRQHLWQGALKKLVDRHGVRGLGQGLERAQAMHDDWATLLNEGDQHSFRFWRRYYQAGLGGMSPLDLTVCDALPDLHRERCLEAGIASWTTHLEDALQDPKKEAIICAAEPSLGLVAQWAEMGPQVHALDHPRLELAAAELQQDSCMRLIRDGPRP